MQERIIEAATGNSEELLELIKQFEPLLQKYARKLGYEDAYSDLQYEFIKLINYIARNKVDMDQDKYIIGYIEKSIIHVFYHLLYKQAKYSKDISYCSMSESELYYLDCKFSSSDEYSNLLFEELKAILTEKEYYVIVKIVFEGFTASAIAKKLGVSKQSVNQTKKRGFAKIQKAMK